MESTRNRIIRVQADTLAQLIGMEPGSFIETDLIKKLAKANAGEMITINGKQIRVTPSAIGLANILDEKI